MAKELSQDYANYFLKNNIEKEVAPIMTTVENLQSRLVECENVFIPTIRHDKEVAKENLNSVMMIRDQFESICSEIDRLEGFVLQVKQNLTSLESQVEIAGIELNVNDPMSPFLKTFSLFKRRSDGSTNRTGSDGSYEPVEIFKTEKYFADKS